MDMIVQEKINYNNIYFFLNIEENKKNKGKKLIKIILTKIINIVFLQNLEGNGNRIMIISCVICKFRKNNKNLTGKNM